MVQLHADNPHLHFVLPKAGGVIWTDNMLIPKKGDATTASAFMNFVYDPKIAAQVDGVRELHLPGQGRRQGAAEEGSRGRQGPADLPDRKALCAKLHQNDPKAIVNVDYQDEVAEAARSVKTPDGRAARRRCSTATAG